MSGIQRVIFKKSLSLLTASARTSQSNSKILRFMNTQNISVPRISSNLIYCTPHANATAVSYLNPNTLLLSKSVHSSEVNNREIGYSEFSSLKDSGLTVIDVRDKTEIKASGTIPGSLNIPYTSFIRTFTAAKEMSNINEESRHLDFQQLIKLKDEEKTVLIDVREKSELNETGTLPGAYHVPVGEIDAALKCSDEEFKTKYNFTKPSLDDNIIFSCRSGKRSLMALETALANGFSNAKHYKGGWLDWEKNATGAK